MLLDHESAVRQLGVSEWVNYIASAGHDRTNSLTQSLGWQGRREVETCYGRHHCICTRVILVCCLSIRPHHTKYIFLLNVTILLFRKGWLVAWLSVWSCFGALLGHCWNMVKVRYKPKIWDPDITIFRPYVTKMFGNNCKKLFRKRKLKCIITSLTY